jgi:hypothetical protein
VQFPEELKEQISKWRRMGYEPHSVSISNLSKETIVVFRTLTKREYDELTRSPLHNPPEESRFLGSLYNTQFQEIIELALLWPRPLPDDLPAAADKLIAEAIIDASAWISTEKLTTGLNEAREKASSLEGFLRSRVFAAFPTMSVDEVNDLRFTQLIDLVASSEIITGFPVDLQPWLDPDGYRSKIDRQERMGRRIQQEREAGMNVDPRMKDPAFRRKLIEQAQESRERLHARPTNETIDLNKMAEQLTKAKNA